MGGQHPRVTDEDREAIRRLHAQGLGRNEIARQIGRAQRTVSVLAAEMGLEFDVTMTEVATRHRIVQLEEKRTILADALTDDALRLSEQLWQPAKVYNIGGKDNIYTEQEVPEPPADAKRALMAAAVAAANQSVRLVPPKDTDGAEEVGSLLTSLFDRLRDRHGDG